MEATELMIGDWIKTSNNNNWSEDLRGIVCRITNLGDNYIAAISNFKSFNVYGNSVNFEPIPLTEEILEKNGYRKVGYFYNHEELGYLQLGELFEAASIDFDKNGINYRIQISPRFLQYVHQLQHALKLCGINKEIEL